MAIDVTEQDFEKVVLDGSHEGPVVVDFWASWCAPCRTLGPVLERVSADTGVTLAKIDVDANPSISAAFGIRSIPTVYAFKDGKVVDQFIGALPEQQVRQFFAGLGPSEADVLAQRAADARDDAEREALYRQALERDRSHRASVLGLSRTLAARADAGDKDEARELLARIPEDAEVARLAAQLDLEPVGDIDALRARVERSPDDDEAVVALARAEAAAGLYDDALERSLEAVRHGSEDARHVMVDVFRVLGDDHALTRTYRPKLAAALF